MDAGTGQHDAEIAVAERAATPWRERFEPWLWLAPSLILLLGIGLYPSIYTLQASFQSWVMTSGPPEWAWFDNYVQNLSPTGVLGLLGVTVPTTATGTK